MEPQAELLWFGPHPSRRTHKSGGHGNPSPSWPELAHFHKSLSCRVQSFTWPIHKSKRGGEKGGGGSGTPAGAKSPCRTQLDVYKELRPFTTRPPHQTIISSGKAINRPWYTVHRPPRSCFKDAHIRSGNAVMIFAVHVTASESPGLSTVSGMPLSDCVAVHPFDMVGSAPAGASRGLQVELLSCFCSLFLFPDLPATEFWSTVKDTKSDSCQIRICTVEGPVN